MSPVRPNRRARVGWGVLVLTALAAPGVRAAPEEPAAARARFLADGKQENAATLAAALAGDASAVGRAEAALAQLAADPRATPAAAPEASGYAAVPEFVAALRRVDAPAAERAAARAASDASLALLPYVRALTLGVAGRDDEAVRSLVDRAAGDPTDRAFRLALFAAALPEEERVLLLALVHAAVVEAARLPRPAEARALAEDAVTLDRALGVEALVCACRHLRRAGDAAAARALLGGQAAARVQGASTLGLERAVDAFLAEDAARLKAAMGGGRPAPYEEALWSSIGRAKRPETGGLHAPACPAHVPEERRDAWLVARVATLFGRPAEPQDLPPAIPGATTTRRTAALEARGVTVLPLAGDLAACEGLLRAGIPIVVLTPRYRGKAFEESAVLLLGRDAGADLWLADEPDVMRSELVAARSLAKARFLALAPPGRGNLLARWRETPAASTGGSLEAAAAAAEQGAPDRALALLQQTAPLGAGAATRDLAHALLLYTRAATASSDTTDEDDVRRAAEAVGRSIAVPPPTATEQFLRGEGLRFAHDVPGALSAYDEAERLGGPASWTQIARLRAYTDARRHAEALRAVDAAWRLDPLSETSLYWRASAKQKASDVGGARADFRRALARRPASREIALDLARLELDAHRPRVALDVLDELCRRDPECATNDNVRDARRFAERALIQAARTVAELLPFRESSEADTRQWLAFALATHETPESEAVLRTLLDDAAPSVRITALRVYMRTSFRARLEADEALSQRVVAILQRDADPFVRGAAAALLSLIPKPFAEEALAARLAGASRDADAYPRSASAAALARHAGTTARGALVAGLDDPDATVRRSAIEALFRIAGTYYGYDPDAAPDARSAAAARWRAWLTEPPGG